MVKKIIVLLVVLALAVVVGTHLTKQEVADLPDTNLETSTEQVEVSDVTSQDSETPRSTEVPVVETAETVELESTDTRGGTALAARMSVDGIFVHTVVAQVSDPLEGKFYEGWLVDRDAAGRDFFSTGAMTKNPDGMWELAYESEENNARYEFVVITEETSADGLDNNPEAHIFEGNFID